MRLLGVERLPGGVMTCAIAGPVARRDRQDAYHSLANACARAGATRLLIDKSQLAADAALDPDYADWDHDRIAEDLADAGVRRVAILDAGRDELSAFLMMALRRARVSVVAAPDVAAARAWLVDDAVPAA